MALRGKDIMGKSAVIGQQHKAGAGLVQTARREQLPPGVGIPHQVHHRGVPLIGGGAHHAFRLVEHEIDELPVVQGFAVHGHGVGFFELGVPFFADGTVHLHPALGQQSLCLAAGALGRLGQIFIQSHLRYSFLCSATSVAWQTKSCKAQTQKGEARGLLLFAIYTVIRRSGMRAAPRHRGWRQRWAAARWR